MNVDDLTAENSMLRAALQDANAQRDAAVARVSELEKYEPRIRSLHVEGGKAELEIENSDALYFLAEICVKLLADAPNFKTAEVLLRQTGEQFNVSVERVRGKSIAKTLSELRETVVRVRELAVKYRDWKGAHDAFSPLHGAGMVMASNEAGKDFLAIVGEEKP